MRIADHYANASNNKKEKKNISSVVVKTASGSQFRANPNIQLVEYVYYPKELTQAKQQEIVKGLQDWLNTGSYTAKADKTHESPNNGNKGITYLKTTQGTISGAVLPNGKAVHRFRLFRKKMRVKKWKIQKKIVYLQKITKMTEEQKKIFNSEGWWENQKACGESIKRWRELPLTREERGRIAMEQNARIMRDRKKGYSQDSK